MNKEDAAKQINDGGEHKFLMSQSRAVPVVVLKGARERELHPKAHEQLIPIVIAMGHFFQGETILGGYCKVRKGDIWYWGESSYPVTAATADQFYKAIQKYGITLIENP